MAAYYALQPRRSERCVSEMMIKPNVSFMREAWRIFDSAVSRWGAAVVLPKLGLVPELSTHRLLFLLEDLLSDQVLWRQVDCLTGSMAVFRDDYFPTSIAASPQMAPMPHAHSTARLHNRSRTWLRHPSQALRSASSGDFGTFRSISSDNLLEPRSLDSARSEWFQAPPMQARARYRRIFLREGSGEDRNINISDELDFRSALRVLMLSKNRVASDHRVVACDSGEPVPIIIYIHGGGFVSDFRASHLVFLQQLLDANPHAVCFYVDYSLAPQFQYPTAFFECLDFYRWLQTGRLGFQPSSVVLLGDSTGGNIATSLCLHVASQNDDSLPMPDALMLACPVLNTEREPFPSPSRALFMFDPILPMNLLAELRQLYLPAHIEPNELLSPLTATDELLSRFPQTFIIAGSLDPFLDDSVDFAQRLSQLNVPVRLSVAELLPHSFLDFSMLLPESKKCVERLAQWLKEVLK